MLKFSLNKEIFVRKLGLLGEQMGPMVSKAGRELAMEGYRSVVKLTGETAQGRTDLEHMWEIKNSKRASQEEFIIRNLYPDQDVVMFREVGTKPHLITPREGYGALRFSIGGEEIFTRVVKHPGTRAHRMVGDTELFLQGRVSFYVDETYRQVDKLTKAGLK